jgi:hypothetical protein
MRKLGLITCLTIQMRIKGYIRRCFSHIFRAFGLICLLVIVSASLPGQLSTRNVQAQDCQVLGLNVNESPSGDCVDFSLIVACNCNPGIGPCGNIHFCAGSICDGGIFVSFSFFCF